jgi:periplasmic protein TonB
MTTTGVSLARVLELNVPRSWNEVVAVALEAGEAMKLAGTAAEADECFINRDGELRLDGGRRGADAAGAVTSLLASLLEGQSAPAELRALAEPSSASAADGIEGVMQALAYFERPNRQREVAALASRALAAEKQAGADAELARLRSSPRTDAAAPPSEASSTRRRPIVGMTAVLLVLIAVAAAITWYLNRPHTTAPTDASISTDSPSPTEPAPPQSGVQSLVSAASGALTAVADAGLRAIGLGPSETAPSPAAAAPPAAATRPAARAPAAPSEASRAAVEPSPGAAAVPVPTVAELPVVVAEPDDSAMAPEVPPGPFTEADAGVEPPVLIYPQLPSDPQPAPPASAPHFELLVNERGEVDQVRLRTSEVRFQDRMMVSAAKAWRFRPATKDGKPVRYRVRVPIPR